MMDRVHLLSTRWVGIVDSRWFCHRIWIFFIIDSFWQWTPAFNIIQIERFIAKRRPFALARRIRTAPVVAVAVPICDHCQQVWLGPSWWVRFDENVRTWRPQRGADFRNGWKLWQRLCRWLSITARRMLSMIVLMLEWLWWYISWYWVTGTRARVDRWFCWWLIFTGTRMLLVILLILKWHWWSINR